MFSSVTKIMQGITGCSQTQKINVVILGKVYFVTDPIRITRTLQFHFPAFFPTISCYVNFLASVQVLRPGIDIRGTGGDPAYIQHTDQQVHLTLG